MAPKAKLAFRSLRDRIWGKHGARYLCTPVTGYGRYVLPVVGLFILLMVWTIITDRGLYNEAFLPSPEATFQAFVGMFSDAPPTVPDGTGGMRPLDGWWDTFTHTSAVRHSLISIERIFWSVAWACLVGIPLGILMGAFGKIESLCQGFVMPMRNAPTIAFIPLFMLLWGVDEEMKIAFLTFGTVVYIIPTTFDAVRSVPIAVVDKAVDLGFRPLGALWFFVLPSALPRIFDGIRLCTGIAWTYLVAAEMINVTNGLGYIIQNAKRFQNTPKVYASIFLILILGVLTDMLFRAIRNSTPILQSEQTS